MMQMVITPALQVTTDTYTAPEVGHQYLKISVLGYNKHSNE